MEKFNWKEEGIKVLPPIFLEPEIEIYDEGKRAEGKCVFPSSDPTIAARGHVNVAHLLFALWNISAVLTRVWKVKEVPRAYSFKGDGSANIPPDSEIDLIFEIGKIIIRKDYAYGWATGQFFLENNMLADIMVRFAPEKKH